MHNVFGSVKDRRQLLTALNLPVSEKRDQVLLQLAEDQGVHTSIREKAMQVLEDEAHNKKLTVNKLKDSTKHQNSLQIKNLPNEVTAAFQNGLREVEQQYADWREFRDSKTPDDFEKTEDYDKFLEEVRTRKAEINPTAAFDYAYELASFDPEIGLELLEHPLYRVRQGAYTAFMMKANIQWLRKLDQLREQRRDNPIFRHAAFRAIDLGLWRLEVLGNKDNDDKELHELEAWQQELEADQARKQAHLDAKDTYSNGEVVDEVLERLQWTTMMMKHTKKMTAKFAKDGWVRDWPENALPVNQPYPKITE